MHAIFTLVLACTLLARVSRAANVAVDIGAATGSFPHFWKSCVGSGHALLGTRADWRQHLATAHADIGFEQIRFHGILDDDMSVVIGNDFHFYNVDQVYDAVIGTGLRPVVELSFMPRSFVKSCLPDNCTYAFHDPPGAYKALEMPPDNWQDWYDLVHAFTQHLVERYGVSEVSKWNFEVWNELWGMPFPQPYMTLFNVTYHAVKSVHPSLRVGGPATMQVQHVADFIQECKTMGLKPDFTSTHLYPSDPNCQTPSMKNDPDCFAKTLLMTKQAADNASLPFYVTEFNDGLSGISIDNHRDRSYAVGFLFHNVPLLTSLELLSWWTFTDIFEEGGMVSVPFHNGFGLQTIHGIKKPAYRAFELLSASGDEQTQTKVTGPDHIRAFTVINSTSKATWKNVTVFVSNFLRGDLPAINKENITVSFAAGDRPAPRVTLYALDDKTLAPYEAWMQMGQPNYPTKEQHQKLMSASELTPSALSVTKDGASFTVTFEAQPYAGYVLKLS